MGSLETLIAQHGDHLPLDTAAALLSAEEQGQPVDPSVLSARLDEIALGARLREGASLFEAVARINHRLFHELGFEGDRDNYDAPENSFLDRVLDRRKGLPILLSVLYIEVARRAGIAVSGIGFPSHYIVQPDGADFFAGKQGSVLGSKAVIAVLLPFTDLFERVSGMLVTPLQTEPNAA